MIASMNSANTDVVQGTLDMLILKTLSLEPMHGFGIARRIEQITQNVFKVNRVLLTALQRLERNGWLDADWQVTENSRRAKDLSADPHRQKTTAGRNSGLAAALHCHCATAQSPGLSHVDLAAITCVASETCFGESMPIMTLPTRSKVSSPKQSRLGSARVKAPGSGPLSRLALGSSSSLREAGSIVWMGKLARRLIPGS